MHALGVGAAHLHCCGACKGRCFLLSGHQCLAPLEPVRKHGV